MDNTDIEIILGESIELSESIEERRESGKLGELTQLTVFKGGMSILLGLAAIFVMCVVIYAIRPEQGKQLLEICKTSIPPLATLIIAFYFKEKGC